MYQKIIIVGYVGSSPEMRYMPDGTAVTNFSLATSERWTDKNTGQIKDKTTWFRVNVWGRQAETSNEHLVKGSKVLVEGKLDCDQTTGGPKTFTRKDGTTSASFELKAETVRFLSGKSDVQDSSYGHSTGSQAETVEEDEVPF